MTCCRVCTTARTSKSNGTGDDETAFVQVRLIESGMSAARVRVRNLVNRPVYLTALQLNGTPLIQEDALVLQHSDETSMTFYGMSTLALDLPALNSLDEAENLARYEVARRKNPRGLVRSIRTDTRQHPTETLSLTLFDRIRIAESQTGHDAEYLIIAEEHQVTKGGRQHDVTWLLEPADSDTFVIIGTSKPDGTAALAY